MKIKKILKQPGYVLTRAIGRFVFIRTLLNLVRKIKNKKYIEENKLIFQEIKSSSLFYNLNVDKVIRDLELDGISTDINLPAKVVMDIKDWCSTQICYADRSTQKGFDLKDRLAMQDKIGKTILVAQYFNTEQCEPINALKNDPVLNQIAKLYLNCNAKCVGTNVWWTFPVVPTDHDKDEQAHMFHHDVDDVKFLKFFFYLTDVDKGDGAHIFVKNSVLNPPKIKITDGWRLRRFSDIEIENFYGPSKILELIGPAGTGFAEDTFGIHKARTPERSSRLLCQIQFSVHDLNAMHDRIDTNYLKNINDNYSIES